MKDAIPKHLLFHIAAVQKGVVQTSYLHAQFKSFAVFLSLIFMLSKPSGWLSPDVEVKVNEETEARTSPLYAPPSLFLQLQFKVDIFFLFSSKT